MSRGSAAAPAPSARGVAHLTESVETCPPAPLAAARSASSLSCAPECPYTCVHSTRRRASTRATNSTVLAASSSLALG
eukprot:7065867-Alexandrium_andersonii.AAC.1